MLSGVILNEPLELVHTVCHQRHICYGQQPDAYPAAEEKRCSLS
ncbi:transporter [Bacillus subtilis]|nr:transporter [Bacillus subtilis]RPK16598.1 hypothetical protein EH2_03647 [Bacillus subtilis]